MSSERSGTPAKPKLGWAAQINVELMFRLIDGILPFEACLYHQVLPLSLEGSRLRLGMVNLDDSTALDYVRRILAYMNCSLVPQSIASDIHHAALTAYLNYIGKQKKLEQLPHPVRSRSIASPKPRSPSDEDQMNQAAKSTLRVDSPEELSTEELDRIVLSPPPAQVTPTPSEQAIPGVTEIQDGTVTQAQERTQPAPPLSHSPSSAASPAQLKETLILQADPPLPGEALPGIPLPGESLPVLTIAAKYLAEPIETLASLSPQDLLQELLGRILVDGIGRLYFERQQNHGRILWSQNGVLKSVLEQLPLGTLQGVIDALKVLTHLTLIPVQKPKQVEIERLYQNQRLLLRLRVMPGSHGEEATVQVLRGAALKFYQQQQLASLSRDALLIAQDLQRKVDEIRSRTRFYPIVTTEQLSILPALNQVLKSVEQQLEHLKVLQISKANEEE